MCNRIGLTLFAFLACSLPSWCQPAGTSDSPSLKNEMRPLWTRSNERFIRQWLVVSEFPLAEGAFERDLLTEHGGESAIRPVEKMVHHLPDGSAIEWRSVTSWGDTTDLANGPGIKRDLTGYAFANIRRNEAGKALLSIGSDESIRAWVNGTLVLDRRTRRQLTFDEDLVEIDMKAGDNALLVNVEQHRGPWIFSARVLERGAVPSRIEEIGPSIVEESPATIVLKTDIDTRRASMDPVTVQAAGAGGKVFAERKVPRGETVRFEPREWPDGAYELRFATRRVDGSLYATHIP